MLVAALILIGLFVICVGIPCIGTAILGTKMLEKVANFPSKTPVIQINIYIKFTILMIVSFALLMTLYHLLADYGQ